MWFVRDVPLVYNVHLSLDWRRFSGNEQKPRQCCRFDLIFAAVLSGDVQHTEWDPDYHLQIKWVMKVIAGKAKICKRTHLNSVVLKYAWDRERSRKSNEGRRQEAKPKQKTERSWATNREGRRGPAPTEERRRADSKRRRGGDRVWRWQKASAGAARYCWDNLNSSAIFKF